MVAISGYAGRLFKVVALSAAATLGVAGQPASALPEHISLANRFSPQIVYAQDEPNLPTSVEWFLPRTRLLVHNSGCSPTDVDLGVPTMSSLQNGQYKSPCGLIIMASGTRSGSRSQTFVLRDVPDADKRGSTSTADWPLYLHAFRNKIGGWTLQYWCFYAFNTGKTFLGIQIGYHGGDWEMFQVDIDAAGTPQSVAMTGHTQVETAPWAKAMLTDGTHPIVFAERGGHEMHLAPQSPPPYIRRGTWPGSRVVGTLSPGGSQTSLAGPIVDMGSKLHPSVPFLKYSGLWGSLGVTPFSSGYWGPPFNETQMPKDSFLYTWCFNIKDPQLAENNVRECYPDDIE